MIVTGNEDKETGKDMGLYNITFESEEKAKKVMEFFKCVINLTGHFLIAYETKEDAEKALAFLKREIKKEFDNDEN